jgi:hypothetical protein
MQKKLGGEQGYLALKDLRIKSKFSRSNMSILEVGRSGENKNPRGRRKKKEEASARKGGDHFKKHNGATYLGAMLGANSYGAKLGAKDYGVVLAAMSLTRLHRRLRGPNS